MGRTGRTHRSMYEGKFDPTGSSTLPLRLRKTGGGKNRKMAVVSGMWIHPRVWQQRKDKINQSREND
ncbi:hypothetical protein Pint_13778 [Pistacia integerrima]|uniref:Uncharacterized protein n=1 Tax=Pistacia integerrima TaxID=434235 RepID=A0ACC0YB89_9ROSI|nr:hypothetical protein Pint_13778 [Pistacia integerrima]